VKEIWDQALLIYNLPLTLLLGLVAIFWIVSLIGIGDVDADLDLDLDADGDLHGSEGIFGLLMRVVNAHDVPVMLVISLLTLFMWMIGVASNFYFNPGESGAIAFGLFIGNFVLSVILVKIVTQPLRPLFRSIKNDKEHQEPIIGSTGFVKSRVLDQDFGQCEILRPKGAPALLNCRLAEGDEPLVRGEEILVIGHDDDTRKFIIKSIKN
jgi:hypothetical protein